MTDGQDGTGIGSGREHNETQSGHVWARDVFVQQPEFAGVQEDLAYLEEQVRLDARRIPGLFQTPPEEITYDRILGRIFGFNEVTLVSWLGRALGADPHVCRHALVGYSYLAQYGSWADQVVDTPAGTDAPALDTGGPASLGMAARLSILQQLALAHFHAVFPPDSPFWTHLIRYTLLWDELMRWERNPSAYRSAGLRDGMNMESYKAALGGVGVAAVALGTGRPELLPALEEAGRIRCILMNLIDDFEDWEDDLSNGLYNSFVAMAITHGFVPQEAVSPPGTIRAAMYTSPLMDVYVNTVASLIAESEALVQPLGVSMQYWRPILDDLLVMAQEQRNAVQSRFSGVLTRLLAAAG